MFIAVQFRSCGEVLCVTSFCNIISADNYKLRNVCLLGPRLAESQSLKIVGLIPDGIFGIFCWHNPSSHTMALESSQSVTEMSTRNIYYWIK